MAVRHIREYYDQVCAQYRDMLDNIKEFQKEAEEGLVEPERLEQLEQVIQPVKNNYMTLSWIIYLLNQPNRKGKEKKYKQQMSKKMQKYDTKFSKEGILEENRQTIEKMKK